MLSKLIKYEWKGTYKVLMLINAFTVFITALCMIILNSPVYRVMDNESALVWGMLLFLLYYATLIGVSMAVTIYCGIRFYKSMYTDEGYLMHTLPVTKNQLILSRLIIHSIHMLITELLIYLSIALLLAPVCKIIGDRDPDFTMEVLMHESVSEMGISIPTFVSVIIITVLIATPCAILLVYGAISLGQTFQKHKVMGSLLCYVGLYCVVQTVTSFAMFPQMITYIGATTDSLNVTFDFRNYFFGVLGSSTFILMVFAVVCYIISYHMMQKKLNLD